MDRRYLGYTPYCKVKVEQSDGMIVNRLHYAESTLTVQKALCYKCLRVLAKQGLQGLVMDDGQGASVPTVSSC